MLDSSIPLMAKGIDGLKMLDDGSQIAQLWQSQKTDSELNRLYKEANGDLNKMMEIGKTSPMARFVMPQLQAQQAAQQKAALDQQKIEAEIGKTWSETGQNNATTQGKNLANAQTLLTAANQALYVATQSGDANAVKLALNNAKTAGLLDDATYNQYFATAEGLSTNPEGLKNFALNLQKAYAQNPEKYNFTTADNVLDNQTSEKNAQLSATVQREKIEQDGQIAQEKLSLDQAKLEFDQKKGTVMQWGDTMYMVYPDNSVKEIRSPTGQKIAPGKPESKIEKIERVEKTQNFAIASRSAADGATLAASLANDLEGMNAAAGGFGLQARVPGSQAHSFASKLETLKSGVFLAQIGNMKGMGALTDAEGARLEKSIAALDLSLSPQDLQANLTQIAQTLSRAAKAASSKAHLYAGQDQPARPKQEIPATLANPFGGEKPNAMDFFK